jgi:hypothetical protein
MRQIPGDLYDLTDGVVTVEPEEGRRWLPHSNTSW